MLNGPHVLRDGPAFLAWGTHIVMEPTMSLRAPHYLQAPVGQSVPIVHDCSRSDADGQMPRGGAAYAGVYDARISPPHRDISELAGVRKVRSEISRLLSIAVDAEHPNRSAGCSVAESRTRILSITRGTSHGCKRAAECHGRSIAPLAWRARCMPPCVNPRRLARCDRSRTLGDGEIQSCRRCIS